MKLVHIADMHLGFKQYQRQTATGINQREADVAASFRRAIDRIIELRPDVVLIAGDVFHAVRPTNPAILHAYNHLSRLVQMLPDASVVIVSGNHDTPRTAETGCLLRLFSTLGIHVVDGDPRRIRLRDGELSVLAVPFSMGQRPAFDPDPAARYNVLLLHDEVEGVINRFGSVPPPGVGDLSLKELKPDNWDYVALGHYHVYRKVAPNAYYSGSLDYATTNIWGEVEDEARLGVKYKGFIEQNLATGAHEFHKVKFERTVIDLPVIEGWQMTATQLSEAICSAVDGCPGGIDDQIVRLVVNDVPRHMLRELDHRSIREFKKRALHFLLDARRPKPTRLQVASGAPGRRASLTDTVRAMLESREVTAGIERSSLVDLGLHYLAEADRLAPATTGDLA
ncbi:MAG: DNA repair exonuclease [Gemmatimonadaceae bacterium]|nr:DNA repair exonuclease [Gemmatimonadaceae bacterium]MDQ3243306.1 DNA repair exonuclease [Gemmatimonadota bacterium]